MPRYKSTTYFWQTSDNDMILPMCNGIVFKNSGDQACVINDKWRLEPGDESPTISTGHPEVVDVSEYRIVFDTGSGGIAPLVNAIYTQVMELKTKKQADACEEF